MTAKLRRMLGATQVQVGAAGGKVTGSAYFARTDRADVLVNAGMFPPPLLKLSADPSPRAFPLGEFWIQNDLAEIDDSLKMAELSAGERQ